MLKPPRQSLPTGHDIRMLSHSMASSFNRTPFGAPTMLILAHLSFSFIVGTLVPVRHPFFRRLIESLNHSPGPPLLFPSHWRFGICRRHPSRFSSPGPPLLFPSHWRFGVCRRHPSRSQSLPSLPFPLSAALWCQLIPYRCPDSWPVPVWRHLVPVWRYRSARLPLPRTQFLLPILSKCQTISC